VPSFPHNCFLAYLEQSIKGNFEIPEKAPPNACPAACASGVYNTCQKCVDANGDFGGTQHCAWNEREQSCMSYALLPANCMPGQCDLVYSHETRSSLPCPAKCSSFTEVGNCLKAYHCGWCAQVGELGKGECMDGDVTGRGCYLRERMSV
jgi:hypothetical protein